MNDILIASYDMEIGGVERSLINMLSEFDYNDNNVDLILYSHTGEFLEMLSDKVHLQPELKEYKTFRQSIKSIIKSGFYKIAIARIIAKIVSAIKSKSKKFNEGGYYQMQMMWKYAIKFLPEIEKKYDVAISYLWPHYFIAEKVNAKKKIAWIHTDYSVIEVDKEEDLKIWNKFDYIVSISESCTKAFLKKYPELKEKIVLVENINSQKVVTKQANESITDYIFDKSNFNLVTTGRLCYQKGFDNAINALRILHDKGYKNIKWYVIGYGGDEEKLKELIKENKLEDSFILLGKKTNPYPYMKNCDLYVQPSRYEGKAVTVVEAQILNKPVLITNYPTAKSQVKENYDGVICELSVEGIADGVEELFKNRMKLNALEENCKKTNYSNSYELEKLYSLYR
mgnify:CR=1 FL=1